MLGFVRSINRNAQVISLLFGEPGKFNAKMLQMQSCDLLINFLGNL